MAAFFNGNTADTIQLISLPLELVGAFLAVTEIWFEENARRIEEAIDNYPARLKRIIERLGGLQSRVIKRLDPLMNSPTGFYLFLSIAVVLYYFITVLFELAFNVRFFPGYTIWESALLSLPVCAFLLVFVLLPINKGWKMSERPWFIIAVVALSIPPFIFVFLSFMLLFIPVISYSIVALTVVMIVRFFNVIAKGRAIGGIGLFLAGLGVLGEVYQVLTMFLGD